MIDTRILTYFRKETLRAMWTDLSMQRSPVGREHEWGQFIAALAKAYEQRTGERIKHDRT